jgi:hypothetical protein
VIIQHRDQLKRRDRKGNTNVPATGLLLLFFFVPKSEICTKIRNLTYYGRDCGHCPLQHPDSMPPRIRIWRRTSISMNKNTGSCLKPSAGFYTPIRANISQIFSCHGREIFKGSWRRLPLENLPQYIAQGWRFTAFQELEVETIAAPAGKHQDVSARGEVKSVQLGGLQIARSLSAGYPSRLAGTLLAMS